MVQRVDVVAEGGHALRDRHVSEGQQAVAPPQTPTTLYSAKTSLSAIIVEIYKTSLPLLR
jgi:hypothetical protein